MDRFLEEFRAEQARLTAELEVLRERARAADAAQQRTSERIRSTFDELSAAARAELASIDAEHAEAVAALRADTDRAVLAHARTGQVGTAAQSDGPTSP